jgi:Rab-3A-interacting protein
VWPCKHVILRVSLKDVHIWQELKLKDDEVEKLSRVRDQVVEELDELTSSLFQEAYDMVNKAKEEKALAEKKTHESVSKVEMLQAEVSALKHLIRESQSNHSSRQSQKLKAQGDKLYINGRSDLNSESFQEFQKWLQMPSLSRDDGFLASCYVDDIQPCMRFQNRAFADNVLVSIEQNKLCMEAVAPQISCPNYCTLSGPAPRPCKFQVKLDDTGSWHFISQGARNRVAAVCDFYSYLRYIMQGIVKTDGICCFPSDFLV